MAVRGQDICCSLLGILIRRAGEVVARTALPSVQYACYHHGPDRVDREFQCQIALSSRRPYACRELAERSEMWGEWDPL